MDAYSQCRYDRLGFAMKVLKFGGSSVADAERIKTVAEIVAEASEDRVFVVLSAMAGITDRLIHCAELAEKGDRSYNAQLEGIERTHRCAVEDLFAGAGLEDIWNELQRYLVELKDILHGVELVRECSPRSLDLIMSFGETLSCTLVASYLQSRGLEAKMVDARELIVTDNSHGAAVVSRSSHKKIRAGLSRERGIPVITGFIAATGRGVTTTLGRNGSDYTASLIGAEMRVDVIEIWTDVDGVMSADPRYVDQAFVVKHLSYEEAAELSYFGAEVLHPYTMIPAVDVNIPIRIRNTLNPESPGTWITGRSRGKTNPITGIASIENVALVNVEGGGLVGIPGIAARILGALAQARVNVIMISQASSEHSLCLVFKEEESDAVRRALQKELIRELEARRIHELKIRNELVIIAVIGENMRGTPGISGRLFSALGNDGINVLAIAQGSSERNISFVISRDIKERAVRSIHREFLEQKP
jgi:aspartokinase/homoserine dehydrogenase 1